MGDGGVDGAGDAGGGAPGELDRGSPQRPPRGEAAIEAWLAERHYLGWRCEVGISAPRLEGNHGRHRICSNDLLRASASGSYPVGAASVKELYGASPSPIGFAVGLKLAPGEGTNTWYWYERSSPSADVAPPRPLGDGIGIPQCAVCHTLAPRDYVFFRAP